MGIFSRKTTSSKGNSSKYRSRYFQSRIRTARGFKRIPKLAPKPQKRIQFRPVSVPGLLIRLLILAVFLVVGYFLVISDYFLVKSVGVTGNIQTNRELVENWILDATSNRHFYLIPKNHQVVINRKKLEQVLKQNSPYISELLEMKRSWPNGLNIVLRERVPVAIWRVNDDYFYIDHESVLFEQLPVGYATSSESYFVITDSVNTPRTVGDSLEISSTLDFLTQVSKYFTEKLSVGISGVQMSGKLAEEIAVKSSENWTVFFDLNNEAERQLKSLDLILNQEIQPVRRHELVYIDLRLPTTAYYCYTGEPCAPSESVPAPVE
ncbi:MAG: hypothetical protein A2826_00950 [Candidatus Doudnabacteria bacterium RIFCSPHIGHO2_01_FULL_43_23]|uniref:POTRA domain-containing protein n=1 Tax=Candidatus Doudnabacteria bacterium RIFCSPHIGHO2_01_FULL_43_23 TaxID=1817822 RepID=A0A1F5NQS5_9BACT|nr:MAG: hypothetical protein A2826_00950 [Candidatus Doudnabacteria bacterium RIFCSPHIGHO2_01_FULL_43_23]